MVRHSGARLQAENPEPRTPVGGHGTHTCAARDKRGQEAEAKVRHERNMF
jgi:hypothetical protein